MDLTLSLDFACCVCESPLSVTVNCTGQGAGAEAGATVATNVPCPHCGQVNLLFFEPTGEVRAVQPLRCFRPLPTPSVN
jgi:hypothetical protein